MRTLLLFSLMAWQAFSQTPPVACSYSDLYTTLQSQVAGFDSSINAQWSGAKPPVGFSGELLKSNANLGLQLLAPDAYNNAVLELSRLQSLGVTAVTVNIGFPILQSSFFQWNGDPADAPKFLNFYKQLAAEIRRRGLKMIVKSNPMFTPGYAPWSCNNPSTGLNLVGYYAMLSSSQYGASRSQAIVTLAQQIKPDYLSIATEPDTEATITGKSFLNSPSGYASMISYILSQLSSTGVTGVAFGAGFGTWLPQASSYVQALAGTSLNYIDLHVYPVNLNWLSSVYTLTSQAQSLGKQVAISEAWVQKERDSEYPTISAMTDCSIFARDAFSFWSPLDQQFLNALVKFSYWKQLLFFSPYWSKYHFAYLDYGQVNQLTSQQTFAQSDAASQTAMTNNQFTSTALAYRAAIGIASPADFQLYAGPSCLGVAVGGLTFYSVGAAYMGFTGAVSLSVSGLPVGVTAMFSAPSVSPSSAASILRIAASPSSAPGTYVLTITGTSGNLVHVAPVSLTVTGAAPTAL